MSATPTYSIEYTADAVRHLKSLRAYERAIVVDAIDEQLVQRPAAPTRRRKKLMPNALAEWELRVGDVRVLYNVEDESVVVRVIAIGMKDGNRLMIEGEEVQL